MKQPTPITHFVGIDISNRRLDCWLRPSGQHLRCGNHSNGFDQLQRWLKDTDCHPSDTVICLEQTGVYGKQLLVYLYDNQWHCALEKTTILDKVGPEHHRKDDKFDAQLLAEYADRFTDQLHLAKPAKPAIDRLQQLCGERRRLVRQRTAIKNKQRQADKQPHCPPVLQESWNEQMALLNKQIQAFEARMHDIISSNQDLSSCYQLLTSIPGVGEVTARIWLIMFYGQQNLNSKKIASRFGVAPHGHRSGSSVRGRTRSSGHGASQMRSALTMAAQSASTHYSKFKKYKERKLEEGKPWPLVRNNIVNKLIRIICAIWNSGQIYDPNHQSRFNRQKNVA